MSTNHQIDEMIFQLCYRYFDIYGYQERDEREKILNVIIHYVDQIYQRMKNSEKMYNKLNNSTSIYDISWVIFQDMYNTKTSIQHYNIEHMIINKYKSIS